MKISFVIPAYNEEAVIGECVAAIVAEIARTPCEAEIVVVNNASTDNTASTAAAAGARVVDEPHKGLVRARKAGFEATSGELVANIDADSTMPPGWLATVLREFAGDAQLVALSGPYIYREYGAYKRALIKLFYALGLCMHAINRILLGSHPAMLQGGNFVIRRDAWVRAGGYDTTIEFYGEDTDVARRLSALGRVRWTWALPMYTSARRLQKEGMVRMSLRYTLNHLAVLWSGRPATREYTDIRPR